MTNPTFTWYSDIPDYNDRDKLGASVWSDFDPIYGRARKLVKIDIFYENRFGFEKHIVLADSSFWYNKIDLLAWLSS